MMRADPTRRGLPLWAIATMGMAWVGACSQRPATEADRDPGARGEPRARYAPSSSSATTCECHGTGPDGPVTASCGDSACGSDYILYACSSAGWTWTGEACGCACTGTGPGGVPVTVGCGETACGSDYVSYACSASGWTWTGQPCTNGTGGTGGGPGGNTGSLCQCEGTGPGGVPVTAECGQSACGSDYFVYACSSTGWSLTGQPCASGTGGVGGGGGGTGGATGSDGGPPALDSGDAGETEAGPVAPVIDVYALLDEMSDLQRLAHPAAPRFRTHMVSSFDRSSTTPAASSDTPTGWYANHDWGNFSAMEGDAGVILDVDGPGCITRIWSATPFRTVRIYLDRAASPLIEAPMGDLLAGQLAPISPPFAGITAQGGNLEFPIPFREHAKITWEGTQGFYQVTYRLYEDPATDVRSLDLPSLDPSRLDETRSRLLAPALPAGDLREARAVLSGTMPELSIAASAAGEEIVELRVRPSTTDATLLRTSVLSLRFDDRETVRAPLGDFFGAGPGLLPHATLPLQVNGDGLRIARFVMPFARTAVVRIDPAPGIEADVTVLHRAAAFAVASYYFHAHWTARGPMASRPYRDVLLADLAGEGAYVGTFLAVDNSSTAWWGEGDEKIWVDSDSFPSQFGTGTEDYFGQAYCSPETYTHPFRSQTLAAGGYGEANGLFSMFRTHVLDPIRFASSFEFNLELWHWDEAAQVTLDTITYFYLAPDSIDLLPLPTPPDFRL